MFPSLGKRCGTQLTAPAYAVIVTGPKASTTGSGRWNRSSTFDAADPRRSVAANDLAVQRHA